MTAEAQDVALSTAILSLPCTPAAAASQLGQLGGEQLRAVALDVRLTLAEQRALAQELRKLGWDLVESGHPRRSARNLPAASPASLDRDERREARLQLSASLRQASELGGLPLVLYPCELALSQPRGVLAERFAWGRPLALEVLAEQRAVAARAALDALCTVLDPVLNEALGLGCSVLLPTPAPWPHQLPDPDELEQLVEIFAGAPLQSYIFVDWMHRARALGRDGALAGGQRQSEHQGLLVVGALEGALLLGQRSPAQAATPLTAPAHAAPLVRVADACGLSGQLPPGSGELDWQEHGVAQLLEGRQPVLCLRPDTSEAELRRSLAWLDRLS